jgi:hypothetical protein
MSEHTGFFTKNFSHTITAVKYMVSAKGTTIKELSDSLSLNRRSVFRLLRNIEADLHMPVIVKREAFGGMARYYLPESFIESISRIHLPQMDLSIDEAVIVYLLATSVPLNKKGNWSNFRLLQKIASINKNGGK